MRQFVQRSTDVRPRLAGTTAAALAPQAAVQRLDESQAAVLSSCTRVPHHRLTPGELGLVFQVCPRTIARWQRRWGLPVNQHNARVLRYPVETVVLLCALGCEMNRAEAQRLGLVPDPILALAATHAKVLGRKQPEELLPLHPVLIGESEDEKRLIRFWQDPVKGAALRAMVRAMGSGKRCPPAGAMTVLVIFGVGSCVLTGGKFVKTNHAVVATTQLASSNAPRDPRHSEILRNVAE